jgi:hypothetical protein
MQAEGPSAAYRRFVIVSPYADEVIRNWDGLVRVSLELDPGLVTGHRIVLILDETPITSELRRTGMALNSVARGPHTLKAAILDGAGRPVMEAVEVNFRVERGEGGSPPQSALRGVITPRS